MNKSFIFSLAVLLCAVSAFAEGPGCGGGSVKVDIGYAMQAVENAVAAAPENLKKLEKATAQEAQAMPYAPATPAKACDKQAFWSAALKQIRMKLDDIHDNERPRGDAEIVYRAKEIGLAAKDQMRLSALFGAAAWMTSDAEKDLGVHPHSKKDETAAEIIARKKQVFEELKARTKAPEKRDREWRD
jgi:hypothetical protein